MSAENKSLDVNRKAFEEKKPFILENYPNHWVGFVDGKFTVVAPKKMKKEFIRQLEAYGKDKNTFSIGVGNKFSEAVKEKLLLLFSVFFQDCCGGN